MKKILLVAITVLMSVVSAKAEVGPMAVGAQVLYGTEIKNVGIGVKYQLYIVKGLRAEAGFNYFFKRKDVREWELNLNAHYVFNVSERFNLYPIAGLTYVSPTYSSGKSIFENKSNGRFGLNVGVGAEFAINSHFSLAAEIKYSLVSKYDQAVFGLGALYKF